MSEWDEMRLKIGLKELVVYLNGKEVQKGGDICVCMADSFCCTAETNTTL